MSRLLSVALTEPQVRERRKFETRRLGWWEDKHGRRLLHPGDRLTLCRKVQGRRRQDGTVEPLARLAEVEVTAAHRERLDAITPEAVEREGFPGMSPYGFIHFFVEHMRCQPDTVVTVIRWRYLDAEVRR